MPSSRPLRLEHGDLGSQLISWPARHVVKCLAFYHPADKAELKADQDATLKEVYRACCRTGHELLLEIILPADMEQKESYYTDMIAHFYSLGIKPDWWKLPEYPQKLGQTSVKSLKKMTNIAVVF